ncbi:MAG: AmmeMemoRadiSam system radical SAM enzyme [Bacteroidales bacterium]|nr:AmmeMemoRadiSam system radical SAM enzyme [Bacteroidales bacterium]
MSQIKTLFFERLDNMRVKCTLCPHICILKENQTGLCNVRKNENGLLVSQNYGLVSALHIDPIEKKPIYHYFPGSEILSVGSIGCNLFCKFCQNWEISHPENNAFFKHRLSPEALIEKALVNKNNIGIAYTYNEPIVYYEYVYDSARLAKQAGLKNIMVSNGYIKPEPLKKLLPNIDAFNIDLKAFTEEFYRKVTKSKLNPVLESLKIIHNAGKHLEITTLIIPGLNDNIDDFEALISWIQENLSRKVPLHLSRYFPNYKLNIEATPIATLDKLFAIAKSKLDFVYLGNIHSENGSSTICPKCKNTIIIRKGYSVDTDRLTISGNCSYCNEQIAITR